MSVEQNGSDLGPPVTITPGPWERNAVYPHVVEAKRSGGMRFVANCGAYPDYDHQNRHNAILIAAAPDLLEAAKHAAMEWRLHGQLTDSCRVLEAAIAKAEATHV